MRDRRVTPARDDLAAEYLKSEIKAPRYAKGVAMQVAQASADLRRRPDPSAPLETQMLLGETFTVYETKAGWAWGQAAYDGYVGYAPAAALAPAYAAPTHRVSALRTYVFPEPDIKAPPMMLVSMNASIEAAAEQGRFFELKGGGFVFRGHVAPLEEKAPDYVETALRYLGAPYLWGGRTSLGLDCSGLVQNALQAAGISAPRDTDMQRAALGREVADRLDSAPRRRGDLAFWKGHVGLMVDEARMVHANATRMETSVDDLVQFAQRIVDRDGPIVSIRRLD